MRVGAVTAYEGDMRISVLAVGFALWGCGVAGNGNVTTTTREVGAFRKLSVGSSLKVTAVQGQRSVVVRADDNLQSLIETTVEGDTLTLRSRAAISANTKLEVDVSNDAFEGLEAEGASVVSMPATPITIFPFTLSGAAVANITGLSSTTLNVNASGDAQGTVTGSATSSKTSADGNAQVTIDGMPLTALEVAADGASTVTARVAGSVRGSAGGASHVIIRGTPTNEVTLSGSATVTLGAP